MGHHISANGLALIKRYEGFSSKPYQLGDGVTTIGYGETSGITMGTAPWSEAYASQRLAARIRRDFEPYVHRLRIGFNQHQFDALVSAIYNLGPGVLASDRSLGKALRSKRDAGWVKRVQDALLLYSMPGSQFHTGLLRRRREEAALFGQSVTSAQDLKRARLTVELDALRAWVHIKRKGDWSKAPKRKKRADYIKRWLGSHPKV